VRPEPGNNATRMSAAVDWLLEAQRRTGNGGVALGYFPCHETGPWFLAYPETTGYIVTSLLRFASRYGADSARQKALEMAAWEVAIQMPTGATRGGPFDPSVEPTPCAFNTGMVLDGLCSAFEETGSKFFGDAALRSANYLVGDLTSEGYFQT